MNPDLSALVVLAPAAELSAPIPPTASPNEAFGQLLAGLASECEAAMTIAASPISSAPAPTAAVPLAAPVPSAPSMPPEIGDRPLERPVAAAALGPTASVVPPTEAILPLLDLPATEIAEAALPEPATEDRDDTDAPSFEQAGTSPPVLPLATVPAPVILPTVAGVEGTAPVVKDGSAVPATAALADSKAKAETAAAPLAAEQQPARAPESAPKPLTAANDDVPPALARPPMTIEPRGRIAPGAERQRPDSPLIVVKPAAAAVEPSNLGRPVLSPAAQVAAQSQTPVGRPGDAPRDDVPAFAVLPMAAPRIAPASDIPPPLFAEVKVVLDDPVVFVHDVAATIARGAKQGRRSIDIRLDPAELGRIEIRLTTGAKGQVQAVIAAENPATYDLLRRDGGNLLRSLQDAGLKADSSSLAFDLRSGTGSDGGRRPYQQPQRRPEPEPASDGGVAVAAAPRSSARGRLI